MLGQPARTQSSLCRGGQGVLVIIAILNIIVMAAILVVVCSIFEAKSLSAHSEEETTRVNSFITRRSFHAATSGPKVPAEPCSPVSAANALCAIVPNADQGLRDIVGYCHCANAD